MGQRGRSVECSTRALRWMSAISFATASMVAAMIWCMISRIFAFDEIRLVSITDEQVCQLLFWNAREHRGTGDLVAVQVQDGQDCAIELGIQEFVGMPTGGARAGFSLAVADNATDEKIRIVECSAICMTALNSRVHRLRGWSLAYLARHDWEYRRATKTEETAAACLNVLRDLWIELRVGTFQISVGDNAWTAMSGAGDVDRIEIARFDHAIHMRVNKVQARRGAKMSEKARLDILQRERLAQ